MQDAEAPESGPALREIAWQTGLCRHIRTSGIEERTIGPMASHTSRSARRRSTSRATPTGWLPLARWSRTLLPLVHCFTVPPTVHRRHERAFEVAFLGARVGLEHSGGGHHARCDL